jgi:hypothetical protein
MWHHKVWLLLDCESVCFVLLLEKCETETGTRKTCELRNQKKSFVIMKVPGTVFWT